MKSPNSFQPQRGTKKQLADSKESKNLKSLENEKENQTIKPAEEKESQNTEAAVSFERSRDESTFGRAQKVFELSSKEEKASPGAR